MRLEVLLGNIDVEAEAHVFADANGTNPYIGHVDILSGIATLPSNCVDGQIPNVTVAPSTAVFLCGPNQITADSPTNTITVINRRVSLLGPLSSSITLGGANLIAASGQVAP